MYVNTHMWTSQAIEAIGSVAVSWLEDDWELRTCLPRCAVINGRHTAAASATFLLNVAARFGVGSNVCVARTDGASISRLLAHTCTSSTEQATSPQEGNAAICDRCARC